MQEQARLIALVEKLEDGAAVVASEVMKGAEKAIQAVEDHPELIAEYADFFICYYQSFDGIEPGR